MSEAQCDPAALDAVPSLAWSATPGREVCICGIGARTPLGLDAASSAAAVRAAISAIAAHPALVDRFGEPARLASDVALDPALPIGQRLETLLQSALAQAVEGLGLQRPVFCWLGMPQPRDGLGAAGYEQIERNLQSARSGLPVSAVRLLPSGHAAGLMAIQAAAQQIASGEAEVCLATGVDSYLDAACVKWLDHAGRLMSGSNRNGFPPGEAAAACLLAGAATAKRNGWPVLAHVAAAATAKEPQPLGSDGVCVGLGLTAALNGVIASLQQPQQQITATYCDLNGERHRNEEFGYALLRTQLAFVDAHDYLCPADCWGDVGAASGPLYAVLAIAAAQRGYATGTLPVMWAGSDNGYRAALLLSLSQRAGAHASGI